MPEKSQSERDMVNSNPSIPAGPRMESLGGRVLESINEPPKEPEPDPESGHLEKRPVKREEHKQYR